MVNLKRCQSHASMAARINTLIYLNEDICSDEQNASKLILKLKALKIKKQMWIKRFCVLGGYD